LYQDVSTARYFTKQQVTKTVKSHKTSETKHNGTPAV